MKRHLQMYLVQFSARERVLTNNANTEVSKLSTTIISSIRSCYITLMLIMLNVRFRYNSSCRGNGPGPKKFNFFQKQKSLG